MGRLGRGDFNDRITTVVEGGSTGSIFGFLGGTPERERRRGDRSIND